MPRIDEKLTPQGMLFVLMCKQPPWAARIFSCPSLPFFEVIWHGIVTVKISDVRDYMKITPTRGVSDHKPGRVEFLEPPVGLRQPGTLRWVRQVNAPAFIHDRPNPNAGMVPITLQHAHQCFTCAAFGVFR